MVDDMMEKLFVPVEENGLADNGHTIPPLVCPICDLFLGWSHVNPNLNLKSSFHLRAHHSLHMVCILLCFPFINCHGQATISIDSLRNSPQQVFHYHTWIRLGIPRTLASIHALH
jgi:hypothetical protein